MLGRLWRRVRFGRPIVVVSGLPRSGTSMMMQMLAAGGLPLVTDDVRPADESNPAGYFELEAVKHLARGGTQEWLAGARGRGVKVVSPLLAHLPGSYRYRVVFMERPLAEVVASQNAMLARAGEPTDVVTASALLTELRTHLRRVHALLARRACFETLVVDYHEALAQPRACAERVAAFVGGLDPARMAAIVDVGLHRQRASDGAHPSAIRMSPVTGADFPTADDVHAIAGEPDAVIRNLWITWSYHRLNGAMAAVVGERDLSWCGFATWASKTAGAFIRREELGPLVERWLDGALRRAGRLRTLIARGLGIHRPAPAGRLPAHDAASPSSFSLRTFAQAAIAQVGDAIAAGNQDVFGHIAPPFARLLTLWAKQGPKVPNAERGAFLDALGALGDGGQGEYLQQAFAATFEAAATPDPRRRAQLMLQANALIGCAEQTRVQPFIVTSMNAPLEDLFNQQLDAHLRARVPAPIARLLHWILRPIGRALEREFQDLSAEWMMRLQLPGESLRLGLDVPPLPDGRMYPEPLDALDAPSPRDLLAQLGALKAAGSAARDWATYGDRMRYLGVLFRSRQQQRVLWDAPFTESQLAALTKGRVPEGPL